MKFARSFACLLATALGLAAGAAPAQALELSHYFPGLMQTDDFFLPPPEAGRLVYAQYNAYYGTDTIRDADGDKVRSVTVTGPGGRPLTVDVDFQIDNFYIAPSLVWAPDVTVLGARYGALVALPIGNPSLAADLQTGLGLGRSMDQSSWGVGDLLVQPLWLMWSVSRLDVTAAYAFNAPTGKYEGGEADNVGLGFWEHQFQNSLRLRLDERGAFAAVLASTFEVGHDKEDADITPGAHWTLNWSLRGNLWNDWCQVAVLGYDSFQISDDSGSDAPRPRHRDQVHAAGVQLGIPRLGLALKYMHEFGARDRFEGEVVTLFFALPLEVLADKLTGAGAGDDGDRP